MNPSNESLEPWQHRVECAKCHDVIYSRHDGEYVSCKCGAIAVDQTPYYWRRIGSMHDFIMVDKNENI